MPESGSPTPCAQSMYGCEWQERLRADSTDIVDRLAKALLEDNYVETDEDVGPRVSAFNAREKHVHHIGRQMTVLRDATSAMQTAHMQLAALKGPVESYEGGSSSLAYLHALAEAQEGSAQASRQMATHYDRFVSVALNQLQGTFAVVQEKYSAYCNKVVEIRRRKAQLQARRRFAATHTFFLTPLGTCPLVRGYPRVPLTGAPTAFEVSSGLRRSEGARRFALTRALTHSVGGWHLHDRHGGAP